MERAYKAKKKRKKKKKKKKKKKQTEKEDDNDDSEKTKKEEVTVAASSPTIDIEDDEQDMIAIARAQRWRSLANSLNIDENVLMCKIVGTADMHGALQSMELALEAGVSPSEILASFALEDVGTSVEDTTTTTPCVQCKTRVSLDDLLQKNGHSYCSEKCIRSHRRELAARAAESRMRR